MPGQRRLEATGAAWTYDTERYDRVAQARRHEQQLMLDYEQTTDAGWRSCSAVSTTRRRPLAVRLVRGAVVCLDVPARPWGWRAALA